MMFVRFDDPLSYCNWQYLHRCFLPFHQSQELVRWCSWLSRQSNNVSSLKVSSSSLGRIKCLIFFSPCQALVQSLIKSYSVFFAPFPTPVHQLKTSLCHQISLGPAKLKHFKLTTKQNFFEYDYS